MGRCKKGESLPTRPIWTVFAFSSTRNFNVYLYITYIYRKQRKHVILSDQWRWMMCDSENKSEMSGDRATRRKSEITSPLEKQKTFGSHQRNFSAHNVLIFTPRDIPTRKHCTLGCLIQCRVHHIKKFFLIESGILKTEANDIPLLTPFGANTKLLCLEFLHPWCWFKKIDGTLCLSNEDSRVKLPFSTGILCDPLSILSPSVLRVPFPLLSASLSSVQIPFW